MMHVVFAFSPQSLREQIHFFFLLGVRYVSNLGANHSAVIKQRFDEAHYIKLDLM